MLLRNIWHQWCHWSWASLTLLANAQCGEPHQAHLSQEQWHSAPRLSVRCHSLLPIIWFSSTKNIYKLPLTCRQEVTTNKFVCLQAVRFVPNCFTVLSQIWDRFNALSQRVLISKTQNTTHTETHTGNLIYRNTTSYAESIEVLNYNELVETLFAMSFQT